MSTHHTTVRSLALCCALGALAVGVVGAGCLPDLAFFDEPPALEPLWITTSASSYLDVGEIGTAGVNSNRVGDTLTYEWSITEPATIVGPADEMVVSYTSPTPCTATLVVIATDAISGTSATWTAQVEFVAASNTTIPPTTPPTVDLGPDRTVAVGQTVLLLATLRGDQASFYDGDWRQVSGPFQTVTPEWASSTHAITVVGTTPGTAVFEFIATAPDGSMITKTVTVEVAPANPG